MSSTQTITQHQDLEDLEPLNIPKFPDNVPTVPLIRVNLEKLLAEDDAEEEKLYRACTDMGFFYVDLRSSNPELDGNAFLADVEKVFDVADPLFGLPLEEKVKYDFNAAGGYNAYFGYKAVGHGLIDNKGTRDRNEFWNMSKNDIVGIVDTLPNPPLLQSEETRALALSYVHRSHALVTLCLKVLNKKLGYPEGTLQGLHRLKEKSGDQLRWVRFPPQKMDDRQIAFGEHTDFGTLTLLFNRLGGLQLMMPGQDDWQYVKPLRGHTIINVGDAMERLTAGVLKSNIHRVVSPPEPQSHLTRDSVTYFLRPEDDMLLKVLPGSPVVDEVLKKNPELADGEAQDASTWILRRATGRRVGGDFDGSHGTEGQRRGGNK